MIHNHFFRRIGFSKLKLTKLDRIVVFFLLSNTPASEFYMPTQKKRIRHSKHGESLKLLTRFIVLLPNSSFIAVFRRISFLTNQIQTFPSPLSIAKGNNEWNYSSTPSMCLNVLDRNTFSFTFTSSISSHSVMIPYNFFCLLILDHPRGVYPYTFKNNTLRANFLHFSWMPNNPLFNP